MLGRIARGDESALSELYDRYAAAALALAMRILGDRAEGEDTVQKMFFRLWREAGRYDSARGSTAAWLIASVRNAALDQVRRRQAYRRATEQAASRPPVAPSEPLAGGDTRKRVADAVASLPPDQREALELAYFDGLSQSEIAQRLALPLGTVKTRMRLGMMKLREALQQRPERAS